MNIKVKDGIVFIYCHMCGKEIEVSDLVQVWDRLHCRKCFTVLGYVRDLVEVGLSQVLSYVIK